MDIAAVIPAQAKNKYSPEGDFFKLGGVSLVEWKFSQLKKAAGISKIYLSSPDEEFKVLAEDLGIQFIKRTPGLGLQGLLDETLKGIKEDHVLWAYPTSPFISTQIFQEILNTYKNLDWNTFDGVITALPRKEYMFFQGEPLNFKSIGHQERTTLTPVVQVTHGASVGPKKSFFEWGRPFGKNPLFFEVDALKGLEIKDLQEFDMSGEFLTKYMRSHLET